MKVIFTLLENNTRIDRSQESFSFIIAVVIIISQKTREMRIQ